ncbi:MAG: DNA-3-methyladenine glycosylase [Bacteroidetes bacterium]|nr:DNA-3-methyladenine glycosylase [Bacteroidota bacterium]
MKKLTNRFYQRNDVLQVARELLGMVLVSEKEGKLTSGRIVEVEAYNGITDKASHAWGGRRTARNEVMYAEGGVCYVYLCYGIHHLFNVVTNTKEIPHAVLIRALEPLKGIPIMLQRTGKQKADHTLTRGPGNLSKALGIYIADSGRSLADTELYLADDEFRYHTDTIGSSPRIGVDYAGEDAWLPYRFFVKNNPCVSGAARYNR